MTDTDSKQNFISKRKWIDLSVLKKNIERTIVAENILLITSLAIVFITYVPSISCYFHGDDFSSLSFAAQRGFSFSSFFIPITQHFSPVIRALFAAQYKLFGCNAELYHWVNMLLHLTNTFLVFILFNSILKGRIYAICTSLLFGVSASCVEAVGWITAQACLMATLCFLCSAILFIQYIQTKKKYLLAVSCCFHFTMLLCYSSGFEVPLLFFFLCLFLNHQSGRPFSFLRRSLIDIAPFVMVDVIILFLRTAVILDENIYEIVSLTKFINDLLKASLFLLGGIFKGYIYSFSGAYILTPFSLMMPSGIILCCFVGIIIIIFLMTDWHAQENRVALKIICLLTVWLFLMYFPAAYGRLWVGYKVFISTGRYRYLPCIPAAGIAITAGVLLRNILAKYALKPGILFAALFSIIIFSNFIEVRSKINKGLEHNRAFSKIATTYIEELKILLHAQSGDFQILDDEFMNLITSQQNRGSGWNVRPSMLAYMYCAPNSLRRILFISPDNHNAKSTHRPFYSVKDGHIYRITDNSRN